MSDHNVIIKDRIYIPAKIVDNYVLNDKYMKNIYNESKCSKCEFLPDRHSDVCDECPANLGIFKLYKDKVIDGKKHVGLPIGAMSKWKKVLDVSSKKVKVIDKRVTTKFKYKIKFIRDLYDYQEKPVKIISEEDNGILISPPRSGKTPMCVAAIVNKGQKALIIASQYDWLEQFYSTIMGNKKEKDLPFTNIPKLEEKYGKKICVLAKDGESLTSYKDADIILCTYQRFLSKKGKKELEKIKKMFGTIVVDEVDGSAAEAYSKVINASYAKSRLGCTGTYDRKDGMSFLLKHIFGKILYKVKIKSLKPSVMFIETGIATKNNYKVVPYAYRFLAVNEKRNQLIVDWIIHDLKANKLNSIVIPATTVAQCNLLVKMVNKAYGKEIACAFTAATAKSKERRTEIKRFAKSGKYRVIVGIRKMVQRGINVPMWNILYEIMPISNISNNIQELSRILTPMEGKPKPIIRQFVEDFGFTRGCLRTAVYQVYVKVGAEISKDQWAIANKYLANKPILKVGFTTPTGTKIVKDKKPLKRGQLI
jgi:superfamily II DNA or RNA helicase